MFVLSKIVGPLTDPRVLLFGTLIVGALLLWTRARRLGRILVTVAVVFAASAAAFPLGPWALAPLETRFPPPHGLPERVDGILVLGGDFEPRLTADRGPMSTGERGAPRLMAFAMLGHRYPQARMVFAGGSGLLLDQTTKEAPYAGRIVSALGIDLRRVGFEDQSRNTAENAAFSLPIAQPKSGETWLIVTSAAHMPRTIGCLRAAGWTATGARLIAYPVDFWTSSRRRPFDFHFESGLRLLARATREWVGLAVYWALGHTDALFPAPETAA